ncbi:MAG: hypothetical protein HON65_08300 [Rhodospirillales bacterium]|nr:hypothetical protein [Rhodospirillales bacterium]
MARAYAGSEPDKVLSLRRLSKTLKGDMRYESVMRLSHHLREDAMDLHEVLDQMALESGKSPNDSRLQLDLLHAIRIALIEHIFILAAQIPPFADRHGITQNKVMTLILSLDIPEALEQLRSVYPLEVTEQTSAVFDEDDTYGSAETGGYRTLHEHLIDPMAEAYEIARQISVGISHHFLAHG